MYLEDLDKLLFIVIHSVLPSSKIALIHLQCAESAKVDKTFSMTYILIAKGLKL